MSVTAEDIKARIAGGQAADIKQRLLKPLPQGNTLDADIEPILSLASGAIAQPVSGLVGLGTVLTGGGVDRAVENIRGVQDALTFQPRTQIGEDTLQGQIQSAPVQAVAQGFQAAEKGLGDASFEATGSPAAGAAGFTAPTAIAELLGIGLLKRLSRKLPENTPLMDANGKVTPELQAALQDAGVNVTDIPQALLPEIKTKPLDAEQTARAARLESFDAPATKGDVTLDFQQQAREARLVNSPANELAEPLRDIRLAQSEAFTNTVDDLIKSSGIPADVGDSIKTALSGSKKLLNKEKNALYEAAFASADKVGDVPILVDNIADAIPSDKQIRRLSRISGNQAGAVDDLLVEFGIITDPDKVKAFTEPSVHSKGGTVEPLSVGNFEEFRQAINQIEKADTTGSTKVITGPIKKALDNDASLISDALDNAGVTDENVIKAFEAARKKNIEVKSEFANETIAGRLINLKKDGNTPLVESSKVFSELMATGKSPELLERIIVSLDKAGKQGKTAIGNLQAATMLDLLNAGLKASTRKVNGQRVLGGTAFNKRLDQIGERRMNALFINDKAALKRIYQLAKTLEDLTPPSGAVPKGSGDVLIDLADRMGLGRIANKTPGLSIPMEGIRRLARKKGDRVEIEAALDASPQLKETASLLSTRYPELAAALGIGQLTKNKNQAILRP